MLSCQGTRPASDMKYWANFSLTATTSLPALLVPRRGAFWRPCDGAAVDVPVDDLAGIVVLASHLRKLWSMQVAFTTFSATSGETHSTRRYTLHWDASMPNAQSTILRTWERRVLNTFFFSSVVARVWAHDVTAQGEGFVCQKHMRHRAKMFWPWEDGVIRDTQCVLP